MKKARDDHLLTIDGEIIARHLESTGYLNMAEHVRRLDTGVARANVRAELYIEKYYSLLRTFDPPKPAEPMHDPQPKPESSD